MNPKWNNLSLLRGKRVGKPKFPITDKDSLTLFLE